ncbi:MAG: hypothetical protein PHV34_19105 [Verrucomicrobiae bacterium]|nr:hypothetical protein [Verrucomicrobiae bacterium]
MKTLHFTVLVFPVAIFLSSCSSPKEPVVVQVNDPPALAGRFRTPERQRDVWIAPQAVDNDVLQHDQTVTFVEKPSAWQLPSTIEPNTVSKPELPMEEGEYDGEALRRHKEMLAATQGQVQKLNAQLETMKSEAQKTVGEKETQTQEIAKKLQTTQQQLNEAIQRVNDLVAAEQQRQEQAKQRSWWQFWKK